MALEMVTEDQLDTQNEEVLNTLRVRPQLMDFVKMR